MPRQTKKDPYEEIEAIRQDLSSLEGNIVALTRTVKNTATEKAANGLHEIKDKSLETIDRIEADVKKHPTQSLITAFGAGLLISALMRRH